MPTVYLGNPFPIFNGRPVADPTAITKVSIPECKSLEHMVCDVVHDDGSSNTGLWRQHSALDAPAWVCCDDNPELETAIAEHFGCPAGRPGAELAHIDGPPEL